MTPRVRARTTALLAIGGLSAALLASLLAAPAAPATPAAGPAPAPAPLAGMVIALDPGHQLGNANPKFADEMAQARFNGYETKACNTTGTETASGYAESTFNWRVARYLKVRLRQLGARVKMTRDGNSYSKWGPCVWDRGMFGAEVGADLLVSIHADGAPGAGGGFFIFVPSVIDGWTDDIAAPSQRMGKRMLRAMADAGAPVSAYMSPPLVVTPTLSTLNFSDVPAVLVELGNMRDAGDAARMTSRDGQKQYADWLVRGIRAALRR